MRTSYPPELTAQGLAEQRKARMAAILDIDFDVLHPALQCSEAIEGLRAIDAEFARP